MLLRCIIGLNEWQNDWSIMSTSFWQHHKCVSPQIRVYGWFWTQWCDTTDMRAAPVSDKYGEADWCTALTWTTVNFREYQMDGMPSFTNQNQLSQSGMNWMNSEQHVTPCSAVFLKFLIHLKIYLRNLY